VVDLSATDWSGFAALVLAPGVPLTHPAPHWTVQRAQAAGLAIIGDIELFCRERAALAPDAPFVAITGTNGKSTTTALIAHVLRQAGRNVQMGGNIGTAILSLAPPSADRVHVIECSSFQIDLAPSVTTMTESQLAEEIRVIADLARRRGLAGQYTLMATILYSEAHHNGAEVREVLEQGLELPSPQQADEAQADVFASRYSERHG
jgi:UDP-N-acetylmuramoylalanine-D-glutamate ligase